MALAARSRVQRGEAQALTWQARAQQQKNPRQGHARDRKERTATSAVPAAKLGCPWREHEAGIIDRISCRAGAVSERGAEQTLERSPGAAAYHLQIRTRSRTEPAITAKASSRTIR
jgi:hypothetical protein